MILLYAVVVGLVAGWIRARFHDGRLRFPDLHLAWLVPLAFAPQWLTFYWPVTHRLATVQVASVVLVSSQLLLLIFAWVNRREQAFWWLGLGLFLNLLVIVLNGGLMPISPETLGRLIPEVDPGTWPVGQRFGSSKDIVLPWEEMRLPWLADRFLTPTWAPQRAAFSVGDVFVAFGAFWLLWQAGRPARSTTIINSD